VGKFAEEIETWSVERVAIEATKTLRQLFPSDSVPNPIGCVCSAWRSNPYVQGSWSYHHLSSSHSAVEQDSETTEEIAQEDWKTLVYAGEADSTHHRGTVHGAYLSGVTQAQRLIQRLSKQVQ
jgi:polyamine oxidase